MTLKEKKLKASAKVAVTRAIAKGVLHRKACMYQKCNTQPKSLPNGKQAVLAYHHLGYDKKYRLDVRWYCLLHHPSFKKQSNYPSNEEIDKSAIVVADGFFKGYRIMRFMGYNLILDKNGHIINKSIGTKVA